MGRWGVVAGLLSLACTLIIWPLEAAGQVSPAAITAIRNVTFERRDFAWSQGGAQAALDWVKDRGGKVTLGAGELKLDRSLYVWDRIDLEGLGRKTTLKLEGTPTSRVPLLRVGSRCRVANLSLVGTGYLPNDRTPYNSKGVVGGTDALGRMDSTTVEGCYFADWNTTAIDLIAHSRWNTIRGNTVTRSGWEGIYIAIYCDSNLVSGNLVTDCRRNAIDVVGSGNRVIGNTVRGVGEDSTSLNTDTFGICVYSLRNATGPVSGNLIAQNIVQSCFDGISVTAAIDSDLRDVTIKDNDVFENRRFGIRLGHGNGLPPYPRFLATLVSNNRVHGNAADGIAIDRLPRSTVISGNDVFSNGGSGILARSDPGCVDSTTITSNHIHNNVRYGIEIGPKVPRTRLEGNSILSNPLGQIHDEGASTFQRGNRTTP